MLRKTQITIVPDLSTLLRLSAEADVRKQAFLTAFRAKFSIDAPVTWMHAEGRQHGRVLLWSDDLKTLHVQNDETGAEYWISPRAVIEGLSS